MTSVSIPATELVRVLNNALQGVAKKTVGTPLIQAAHIKWGDGFMTVTATDRCIIIRDKVPAVEMDGTGSLLLPTDDVRNVIRMVGNNPGPVLATLSLDESKLIVEVEKGATLTVDTKDPSGFPRVDSIFTPWEDKPLDFNHVAFNSDLLGKICKLKADRPGVPIRFQLGETILKSVQFKIGQTTAGVVVPARLVA